MLKWKLKVDRKPLILNGARQVGKTFVLREFAEREFAKHVYFSLDRDAKAKQILESGSSVQSVIMALSALSRVDITPNDTLIVVDEIQESPKALNVLKFFCEDAPDYPIAVAGSLLGISLHGNYSFPVGKVDMLKMYPMSFEEFLSAMGKGRIVDLMRSKNWEVVKLLKGELVDLLRQYYYVGGMPAVVQGFVSGNGLGAVREMQEQILFDYARDFSKHAPVNQVPRINMVWNSIPSQLAKENKKFVYGAMKKGARANDFELAIQWLIDAGLVYKVNRVSKIESPLKFYEDFSSFKLFLLDVGLMGAMVGASAEAVLVNNAIFKEYKGAFTELFVCDSFICNSINPFYYSSEDAHLEVDFVIQGKTSVFPVEVKAEENVYSKSLRAIVDKQPGLKAIRLSMKDLDVQDWMTNLPLYAFVEEVKSLW